MDLNQLTTNNANEYFTKDLGEATAIYSQNIKLLRLEKDPSGFWWFVFPSDKSKGIADSYWSEELQVIAKRYSDWFKALKDRMYSQKNYKQPW